MERKWEEQARQYRNYKIALNACNVRMISCLGKDVREGDRVEPSIVRNKGKEPVISGDDDALTDDELSSKRSQSMIPPPGSNSRGSIRAKSQRKHTHHLAFSDVVSGVSRQARE